MTQWGFDPTRPVVMVVDPMPAILRAVSRVLREHFEVETATTVEVALAIAKRRKLDLLVTELVLTEPLVLGGRDRDDSDGLSLVRTLREMDHRCPVVMLTTHATDSEVATAVEDRLVAAVISKPWSNRALLQQATHWARERRS